MAGTSPWNWPMRWRVLILLNVSFYNMMGNIFASGVTPLFGLLIEEFHVTTTVVSHLPTYALLTLGVANIWALPFCAYIGKRYTILVSLFVFLAANIWASQAGSYKSLLATRFVGGLSGGVIEALGPLVVSELFPEHQLSRAMVVYVGLLAGGSAIGPIMAGLIGTQLGSWRWFFGIISIAVGINLVTSIIMLPETSYAGEWDATDLDMQEIESKATKDQMTIVEDVASQTDTPAGPNLSSPTKSQLWNLWKDRSFFLPWKLSDISRPQGIRFGILSLLIQPFPLLLVPPILLTTIIFGLTIGWTVIFSILFSDIFQNPPHLWSAESVGLLSIAPLVGIVFGLPVGGPLADNISARQTKRSNGCHSPRSRLPLVLFGALISPSGVLLTGYSLRTSNFNWVGVAVGWAMLSVGLTASANILLTYSVDCFRHRAGHVGVLVNIVKNCLGFGVSYTSIDWYTKAGPVNQMGVMAGILWAFYLLVPFLYFFHSKVYNLSVRILEKF